MFTRPPGIDHTGTDSVHGDTELAELLRGRARQSEKSSLRCRIVRTAKCVTIRPAEEEILMMRP